MPTKYLQDWLNGANAFVAEWTSDFAGAGGREMCPWFVDRVGMSEWAGDLALIVSSGFSGQCDLQRGALCPLGAVYINSGEYQPGMSVAALGDPMGILKISGTNYIDDLVIGAAFTIHDGNFMTGKILTEPNGVLAGGRYMGCDITNSGRIDGGVFSSGSSIQTFGDMTQGTVIDGSLTIYSGANVGIVTGQGVELSGLCTVNNSGVIRYLQGNRTTGASQLNNSGIIDYIFADENLRVYNGEAIYPTPVIRNGRFESLVTNYFGCNINDGVFKGGVVNFGSILNCYANTGINYGSIVGGAFTGDWTLGGPLPYKTAPTIRYAYFKNNLTVFRGSVRSSAIGGTLTIYDSGNGIDVLYSISEVKDTLPGLDLSLLRANFHWTAFTGRNEAIDVIAQNCNVLGDVYLRDSWIRGTLTVSSGDLVQNNVVLGNMVLLPSGQMGRQHEQGGVRGYLSGAYENAYYITDAYEYLQSNPNLLFGDVTIGTGAVLSRGTLMKGPVGGAMINHGSVSGGFTILNHRGITNDGPLFIPSMPTEVLMGLF